MRYSIGATVPEVRQRLTYQEFLTYASLAIDEITNYFDLVLEKVIENRKFAYISMLGGGAVLGIVLGAVRSLGGIY